jgi:hypothetical protein
VDQIRSAQGPVAGWRVMQKGNRVLQVGSVVRYSYCGWQQEGSLKEGGGDLQEGTVLQHTLQLCS